MDKLKGNMFIVSGGETIMEAMTRPKLTPGQKKQEEKEYRAKIRKCQIEDVLGKIVMFVVLTSLVVMWGVCIVETIEWLVE